MRLGDSRNPVLVEVLQKAVQDALEDLHVALPGRIESYDAKTQKADVKPLLKRQVINDDESEELEELPVIRDVPLRTFRAGKFFVSFPFSKGDYVLLIFCDWSIDDYMAGSGGDTDPRDLRSHDLSDAFAIPLDFGPFMKSVKDASATELVVGVDDGGMQIKIYGDNKIEIVQTGHSDTNKNVFTLTGAGTFAKGVLGSGTHSVVVAEALTDWWATFSNMLQTWLNGHTHPDPVSGSTGTPTPPLFSAGGLGGEVISNRLKIPPTLLG